MPINVTLIPATESDPLGYALKLLLSGKQSFEAFQVVAEYFSDHFDKSEKLDPDALKWLTTALSNIANGDKPDRALGIAKNVGRAGDTLLATKISAFIQLQLRNGKTKDAAIQLAEVEYRRSNRHIQRLLSTLEIDFGILGGCWANNYSQRRHSY